VTDRLIREGNPPTGQLACPVPQHRVAGSDPAAYEATEGQHGAPYSMLVDSSGNPISPASEAKLEAVRLLLASIDGKDLATQTTLAAILAKLIAAPATEAKQDALKTVVDTLATEAKLELVRSLLADIKTNQTSGEQKVQLNGSYARLSQSLVTGVKTVTGTAAEIFAGASRLTNRSRLMIRNLDSSLRIRVGSATVSDTTGFGIEPGAVYELDINPAEDVTIYAISEAGKVSVEVFEG
jgi:hypothetical protein